MIKRLSWFLGGAVAGAAGTGYAKRKVKSAAAQLAPANVARNTAHRVRARAHDATEAVREGRLAMRSKERELRAKRDDDADRIDAMDVIATDLVAIVDAQNAEHPEDAPLLSAEAGRVIVLREAQSAEPTRPRRARR